LIYRRRHYDAPFERAADRRHDIAALRP
jgi:hypothetical protein